jgi:hypothetical protein
MGAPTGVHADFRLLATQGSVTIGGAVISNIEHVEYLEGSAFDDFLAPISSTYAAGGPIYGRGGNDHIVTGYYTGFAGGGVFGGDGNDLIDNTGAAYGPATYGEAGNDTIIGGSSYERLDGATGMT